MASNDILSNNRTLILINQLLFNALTPDGTALKYTIAGDPNLPVQKPSSYVNASPLLNADTVQMNKINNILANAVGAGGINVTFVS